MKKVESLKLNKFKGYELKADSIKSIVGGKQAYTKASNGVTTLDTYSDTAYSNGNYPAKDLIKKEPAW